MVRSPNDMDPPDYVVGDFPEEAMYEAIYEKFPWVEDDGFPGNAYPELAELIAFVIEKAHDAGVVDSQRDIGEYIDHLEGKIVDLEQQNKILENQRDRMTYMYHGVEGASAPQTDEEWLEWKPTPVSGQGD